MLKEDGTLIYKTKLEKKAIKQLGQACWHEGAFSLVGGVTGTEGFLYKQALSLMVFTANTAQEDENDQKKDSRKFDRKELIFKI